MKNKSVQRQLDWLDEQKRKDDLALQREKEQLINQIKKIKKEDILPPKPQKLTLWQRIKKVLMS